MKPKRQHIWKVALVLLTMLLLFPWQSTVAPAIRVQILDEAGNPASRVVVRQYWGHFNFGAEGEEYARTDDNGFVTFPERYVRGSTLSRTIMPTLGLFTHAGFGPRGGIRAHGTDPHVWTTHNHTTLYPAPGQLRLERGVNAMTP